MKFLPAKLMSRGFTLIELLIVIAIIGLFIFPLLGSFRTSRTNEALRSSTEEVANVIRTAHIYSREAKDKKEWGIKSTSVSSYILYSKTSSKEETSQNYVLPVGVEFDKGFDLIFQIGTGEITSKKEIRLINTTGQRMEINILKTGVVETKAL